MPRQARQASGTGIYHVMMRGINHQNIFEEQEDYYQFLNTLDMMALSYEPDGRDYHECGGVHPCRSFARLCLQTDDMVESTPDRL